MAHVPPSWGLCPYTLASYKARMAKAAPEPMQVEFEVINEAWSSIGLLGEEGFTLEVKPVVFEVTRTDEVDAQDRPVYVVKAALVTRLVKSVEQK